MANLRDTASSRDPIDEIPCLPNPFYHIGLVGFFAISSWFSIAFADDLPAESFDKSALDQRIELLQESSNLTEVQRAKVIELLHLAITRSEAAAERKQQALEYSHALNSAPLERARLKEKSANLDDTELPSNLSDLPLARLEALFTQEQTQLAALRRRSAQIEADTKEEKDFDIQTALEDARKAPPKISLESGDSEEGQSARRILAAVTRALREANVEMLEQRLLSRDARLSLWESEQTALATAIAASEGRLVQVRVLISGHRQSEASQTSKRARSILESVSDQPQAIRGIGLEITQAAEELEKLILSHDQIIREKEKVTAEAQRLDQKFSSLTGRLEIAQLDSSPEFGAALRRQRDQLVDIDNASHRLREHEGALTKSRLAQFHIDELRSKDSRLQLSHVLKELALEAAIGVTHERERTVQDLLKERDKVLDKLSDAYSSYISDLTSLTAQSRAFIDQSKQYAAVLDQRLLWMPSTNVLGLDTLSTIGTSLGWLIDAQSWIRSVETLTERAKRYPAPVLFVGLILLFLLRRRSRLIALLATMKNKVGKVNRDKMSLTLIALFVTVLLSLPGPLATLLASELLSRPGTFSGALANALSYGAMVFLIFELIAQGARRDGLLEAHFKWSETTVSAIRRNLRWFMAVFIPAIALNALIEEQGGAAIRDGLGRITFITANLVMATFVYRVLVSMRESSRHRPASADGRVRWNIGDRRYLIIALVPLLIAALSAFGHHYTAVQLGAYLWNSAMVVMVGTLLYCLAQREFAISERRLALARVRAKRAAAIAQSGEGEGAETISGVPTDVELQEIDLQTVSLQTKTLLKMVVMVGVGLALWNVWSEILPAFKPLEHVTLWEVVEFVEGVPSTVAVTLWDLLIAVATSVITFLAAKNIPGVLEVTLLSRMPLKAGSSYAITTISRYVIVITGIVVVLQLLGAQWSKLQWLIAALSVGLGFGLQEIVANFVSGVVILFERPIRIGDTVTVGDQWGTISKMHIRATTIVDWDRREIIIPNKTFVTERLVNWTLTDPITRKKIRVGVAYGSDIETVERVLLAVARANPKVLDDPPPEAFFLSFGESSLDFSLRVFVKGFREHSAVVHELHVAIDREFRANGIVIAFPQQDLHFDSKPIAVKLVDEPRPKGKK